MSRFDEALHGVPYTKGGGATAVEMRVVEPVDGLIQNDRLGDSAEKILKKISRNDGSLPLSEIGVFMDQNLEKRMCERLAYYDLLEKVEGAEDVITPTGPVDKPAEYKLTEKGEKYLDKIGG